MKRRKVGQITIKRVGKKYAVCIAGTPERMFTSKERAMHCLCGLRKKYGRRENYKRRKNA